MCNACVPHTHTPNPPIRGSAGVNEVDGAMAGFPSAGDLVPSTPVWHNGIRRPAGGSGLTNLYLQAVLIGVPIWTPSESANARQSDRQANRKGESPTSSSQKSQVRVISILLVKGRQVQRSQSGHVNSTPLCVGIRIQSLMTDSHAEPFMNTGPRVSRSSFCAFSPLIYNMSPSAL